MNKSAHGQGDDEMMRLSQPPNKPEDLWTYVPYLLNRLTTRYNTDQNRDLSDYGIGSAVLRTLSVLHIHKTLTVNEIAAYAVIEQSNSSRTVDSMVRAGLVERRIAKVDQRRRQVVLTEKGREQLKRLWPIMARNHARLIDGIPAADLEIFVRTLHAMIHNVHEEPI